MFGVISGGVVVIIALIYYLLLSLNESILIQKDISLKKQLQITDTSVYATCIDKQKLSLKNLAELEFKSSLQKIYVVNFQQKPTLQCIQILGTLDFNNIFTASQKELHIKYKDEQKQKILPQISQTLQVSQENCKQVQDTSQFFIIFTKIPTPAQSSTQHSQSVPSLQLSIKIQNVQYSKQIFRQIFWFSWFNLIGICLIAFYRKNVFHNSKIKLQIQLLILLFLLFVPIVLDSFLIFQRYLQILILVYIGIVLLKSQMSKLQILGIIILFFIIEKVNYYVQNTFITFLIILISILIGLYLIAKDKKLNQIRQYSIINFLVLGLLQNKYFYQFQQFTISLIYVGVIMFGISALQILQLRVDFNEFKKKNQVRLQAYQMSQHQNLQNN